jgi:DeoR/GlpR family transcriptional regulator of sugar metabolism
MRHTHLLNLVNQKKRVAVTELAQALNVSEVTIRKDLNLLERKGLLRREHGYAAMPASDDIANHLSFNYERKRQIAQRAAETIHNGETVMIESGGCCALLAEELATNRRDVTIITNSAFIADYVRKQPNAHIILLGGEYQNESQVMIGPMIQTCVKDFSVNKFFVGTDGLNEHGFMSNDIMRAEAARTMANSANQVIVLTESSKFQTTGVVSLLPLERVSAVYTDGDADSHSLTLLNNSGIHVYPV